MKILIVDDEAPIRMGIEKRIRKYGYDAEQIYLAAYARQAMDIMERTRIDLAFVDINMPFMNGLDLIARYKKAETAFVIVSGYDDFSYAQRAIELGVERYLLKPINAGEFQRIMDEMTERFARRDEKNEYGAAAGQIISCIRESLSDGGFCLTACAQKLSMSESNVGKILKKDVGIGFSDLLNQYRIEKAIQLIGKKEGQIRSGDLASECGFSSQQYFSVVFRKITGMTPSQYKEKTAKVNSA